MKKVILASLLLLSSIAYSTVLSLESGYLNGTNEGKYNGLYFESLVPVHSFTENIYLSVNPFVHIVDEYWDPGLLLNLNLVYPLNNKWNLTVFGGIGGMYLSTKDTRQDDNYNFKENIGIGLDRCIGESTRVYVRASVWHISNGGITDGNSGINGNSIGLGFIHSF